MAPPFVVLSAWLCGQAFAHGNDGYNTVGRGFEQGWAGAERRLWRVGGGKVCLHSRDQSEIRAEFGHKCTNFFTGWLENLPVVRKILFVQYLGAALRPFRDTRPLPHVTRFIVGAALCRDGLHSSPQILTGIKNQPEGWFLIAAQANQPRGLPRPRPAGLSPSGLPGRLRISLGRSATVLPRPLLRGDSSRGWRAGRCSAAAPS